MDRKTDPGPSKALMSSGLQFDLVDDSQESQLRALLRETPLGGAIQATLRREPSYFDGAVVEGPFHQVLAARRGQSDSDASDSIVSNSIVAMATRSVRMRYVSGIATPVGYLGGLRIRESARKGLIIARGFQKLRQLHEDGRTDFYLTTVTEGNTAAIEALTKGRAGLPSYHELGRYCTFILPTHSWKVPRRDPTLQIRPLQEKELSELVAFLNREGQSRLFFPVLNEHDFLQQTSTYRDLSLEQILCARRDGRIVGTLAAWDQSAFKQSHVERYTGHWRWSRHLYNPLARCLRLPSFPAPGDRLRNVMLALPVIENSDPAVWQQLLHQVRHLPVAKQNESMALGLFERDPLVPFARRSAVHCYETRLYVVSWSPEKVQPEQFNGRNVYLELGCL
jgi:hypothetical protein